MDGGSFSTTCEFLSALHAAKRATFLATETAGGYFGNSSGRFATVSLPNTRRSIRIPLLTYYASAKNASASPTVASCPVPIEPTIKDLLGGRDPAMERALGLARVKAGTPRL